MCKNIVPLVEKEVCCYDSVCVEGKIYPNYSPQRHDDIGGPAEDEGQHDDDSHSEGANASAVLGKERQKKSCRKAVEATLNLERFQKAYQMARPKVPLSAPPSPLRPSSEATYKAIPPPPPPPPGSQAKHGGGGGGGGGGPARAPRRGGHHHGGAGGVALATAVGGGGGGGGGDRAAVAEEAAGRLAEAAAPEAAEEDGSGEHTPRWLRWCR